MKIFISWSGELSHRIALIFREWLPSVIQAIEPYVSSEDIDKGTRWSTDISKELEASSYGILCVTSENIDAPWLNFEAGALSKSVDKSRVSPFLYGIKRSEVRGPLLQFQSTIYEKDDVKKLLDSINATAQPPYLDEVRLSSIFEVWWPRLQAELKELKEVALPKEIVENRSTEAQTSLANTDVLEEILDLVRNQQKILNSPETLLPMGYVAEVLNRVERPSPSIPRGAYEDLSFSWGELISFVDSFKGEGTVPLPALQDKLDRMAQPLEYIVRKMRLRTRISEKPIITRTNRQQDSST